MLTKAELDTSSTPNELISDSKLGALGWNSKTTNKRRSILPIPEIVLGSLNEILNIINESALVNTILNAENMESLNALTRTAG